MKTLHAAPQRASATHSLSRRAAGFTLIELLVAMVVFLIVAGTAFSAFDQHMQTITEQESLSGVNLALRNATAQLQMDLASAAQNLLQGAMSGGLAVPPFSAGVIINDNVPAVQGGPLANCAPTGGTWAYPVPSSCFDSITIFAPKGCAVLAMAADKGNENLNTSTTMYATDPDDATLNNVSDATCFHSGDELLVIAEASGGGTVACGSQASPTSWSYCITAVTLTAQATVPGGAGTDIKLPINVTSSSGARNGCPGASCSDPLDLLSNARGDNNFTNALGSYFVPGLAYIVDVGTTSNLITYQVQVNPVSANDAQLERCDNYGCAVLADQIIGFKVGAALSSGWDSDTTEPDAANYFYDDSKYCSEWVPAGASVDCSTVPPPANDAFDYSLVRAVRVSLIARTAPHQDPTLNNFANGFDGGPYLIQQASTIVDLRGISISDYQN